MVKFSKQFEGQLVPEWKEAFVDYWQLKKDLKKIHLLDNHHKALDTGKPSSLAQTATRFFSPFKQLSVHKKLASSASKGDLYETELLEQLADTDAAKEFFARLDLQLNKVNQFYKGKEKEFMERGESLKKQMDILIELKSALKQQRSQHSSQLESKDDPSISCTISCEEEESVKDANEQEQQLQDSSTSDLERNEVLQFTESPSAGSGKPMKLKREESRLRSLSGKTFSCQGKNMRLNIPLTTPTLTISAITYLVWEDLVNQSKKCGPEGGKLKINKTKLHHAEKMIRGAFSELYKGLGFLKTYRNLNMLAFAKILKKFDKVTGKQVLPIYLKVVESSYFNSSDKILKLMDEVEELFVDHFADADKRKAMKYLRPTQRKESHAVTFFIGLFTGCFIALFAGYSIMAHLTGMYTPGSDIVYMETVYPVLRQVLFLLVLLCPFNIVYKSSRYHFLQVIRNIILSPFYKVVMVDFFMADQLCSQCARRWFDEGQTSHLINLGKYVSAMLAAGAKVAYEKERSVGCLSLVVIMSSAATIYQLYWDYVKDWGLLQAQSKNPWLRNDLMLRRKIIYFFSMGLNLVLRLAWLQTVLHSNFGSVDYRVTGFFLAALEVIRRGQWNFYRLENEHLNNAGKFRAVKTVPLPFHEVDQD
ncbi:hypothetical protein ACLOJK_001453 [Asimina triloba]